MTRRQHRSLAIDACLAWHSIVTSISTTPIPRTPTWIMKLARFFGFTQRTKMRSLMRESVRRTTRLYGAGLTKRPTTFWKSRGGIMVSIMTCCASSFSHISPHIRDAGPPTA
jgi:hypothetical protein